MSLLQRNGQTRWKPSYLRRQGHMTKAQRRYFRNLWPVYGVELPYNSVCNPNLFFKNVAPLHLEIGFGQGETLLHRAQSNPDHNFIGIEVHKPAISSVLKKIESLELQNVMLLRKDALLVLADHLVETTLDEVWIFFPEPWKGSIDQERRILRSFTLQLLKPHLKSGALLFFATDVEEYAQFALKTLRNDPCWFNSQHHDGFSPRPHWRQQSKYESKGMRAGRKSIDLCFSFQPPKEASQK